MVNTGSSIIESPEESCPKCGWTNWGLVKCKNRGGIWQYFFMCDCGYRKKDYILHKTIKKLGIDPKEVQPPFPRNRCEVCGADGAHNHHWAPVAIFGDIEAEKWPRSFLCQPCHTKWHQLVTPDISNIKT